MADVRAFKALRFTDKAGDISKNVCPPYDIISDDERKQYIKESGNNIIRLEKPTGCGAYKKAKELYLDWSKDGIIVEDDKKGKHEKKEEANA